MLTKNILAVYYAAASRLMGLHHRVFIGFAAGLLSFIPYIGALTGIVISLCVAIAQFWPDWTKVLLVPVIFLIGLSWSDMCCHPTWLAAVCTSMPCG